MVRSPRPTIRFPLGAYLITLVFLIEWLFICQLCLVYRPHIEGGLVPLGADLIVHGRSIYKDLFTIVWPGSFLMLSVPFALFGATWTVARLTLATTIFIGSLLSYRLARTANPHWSAIIPALTLGCIALPTWTINYYSWDALFFVICFVYCLGRLVSGGHKSLLWALGAGLAAGAAAMCYQPLLLVAASGIVVETLLCHRTTCDKKQAARIFCALTLPVCAAVLATFLYAIFTGGFREFISQTLLFPMHDYANINKVAYGDSSLLSNLQEPSGLAARILFWMLCFVACFPWLVVLASPIVCAVAIAYVVSNKTRFKQFLQEREIVVIFLSIGFASWLVGLHRPEIQRLFWGSFLLLIAAFNLIRLLPLQISFVGKAVKTFYAITITGIVLYVACFTTLLSRTTVTLHTRAGDVQSLQNLDIVGALQDVTSSGEKVLVYPYDTALYFLTKTRFPSIHPWLQYRYNSKQDMIDSITDMEKSKVAYVVWDSQYGNDTFAKLGWKGYKPLPQGELIMDNYLHEHFTLLKQYGQYRLMIRK